MRSAGLRGTHYQTTQSLRARQDARIYEQTRITYERVLAPVFYD